jgi:hypothetical protein
MIVTPVCVKLLTGEELFTELIADDNDPTVEKADLVKVYRPYSVKVVQMQDGMTQFAMKPWVVYSDDLYYYIPAHSIVSISKLDSYHSKLFGSTLLQNEINDIRSKLLPEAKAGIIPSVKFQTSLELVLQTYMKYGIRYSLPIPTLKEVKRAFHEFILTVHDTPEEIAVTQ